MKNIDLIDIFAKNVRYYRFVRGLTQEQLAEKCNLSSRYISDIENANGNVSLYTLEIIAISLDVDPFLLIYKHPHLSLPKRINMK